MSESISTPSPSSSPASKESTGASASSSTSGSGPSNTSRQPTDGFGSLEISRADSTDTSSLPSVLRPAARFKRREFHHAATCQKCHRTMPIAHFVVVHRRLQIRNKKCNQCRNRDNDAGPAAQRKKEIIRRARDQQCMDCGGRFPAECMDFDHVRGEREFYIGTSWRWVTEQRLRDEMAKCDVVCSNCHRIRTTARMAAGQGKRRGRPPAGHASPLILGEP